MTRKLSYHKYDRANVHKKKISLYRKSVAAHAHCINPFWL